MASGSDVWAIALTSDPARKMAVSTAFFGNDTVMLRYWFSITASQRAARMREQSIVPQGETWIVRSSASLRKRFAFVAGNDVEGVVKGGLRCRHRLGEVVRNLVEEAGGGQPALVGADQEREVLGHVAFLDGVDANFLQGLGKLRQFLVVVELGAVGETLR